MTHAAPWSRPKIDLHCHLDGAARPATLLELSRQAGVPLPADDVAGLRPHVQVGRGCGSLREFLRTFDVFYPVLRVPGALERVGEELIEDAAGDNVVHIEVRLCPALQATDRHPAEHVLGDALAGLAAGGRAHDLSWGAIVCCYRELPAEVNRELVELAIDHTDRGVVGVDLAGPEDLPGAPSTGALRRAHDAGLPITVHAGEAAGPESIREALDVLGACRLGHAVALREDAALARRVAQEGVALECCLTSNLHTGAVASLDEHPFDTLRRAGCRVTLNTDDPAVSAITLGGEYALAARQWGYDEATLDAITRNACDAAFVDDARRAELRRRLDDPVRG